MIPGIGAAAQARLAKVGHDAASAISATAPLRSLYEALGRDYAETGETRLGPGRAGASRPNVKPRASRRRPPSTPTCAPSRISSRFSGGSSEKVSRRLKAADLAGQSITLKLKDSEFRHAHPQSLRTCRRRNWPFACSIRRVTCSGLPATARAFRLIGVGARRIFATRIDADRGDLADQTVVKQAHMESAIDRSRDSSASDALQKGIALAQASALTGGCGLDLQGLQIAL